LACNPYSSVLRAARQTVKRSTRDGIEDLWAYTVSLYSGNLARLSHLYSLTHLAECGLRTQVDLRLTAAYGEKWHVSPDSYLPSHQIPRFVGDQTLKDITWSIDPTAMGGYRVQSPGSASDFLERITLGWLNQFILAGYVGPLREVLVTPEGRPLPYSQVEDLLDVARDARNDVAHNRYVPNERYAKAETKLVTLLSALRFDVANTLRRVDEARAALREAALKGAK
jgi:hypothetical protein